MENWRIISRMPKKTTLAFMTSPAWARSSTSFKLPNTWDTTTSSQASLYDNIMHKWKFIRPHWLAAQRDPKPEFPVKWYTWRAINTFQPYGMLNNSSMRFMYVDCAKSEVEKFKINYTRGNYANHWYPAWFICLVLMEIGHAGNVTTQNVQETPNIAGATTLRVCRTIFLNTEIYW